MDVPTDDPIFTRLVADVPAIVHTASLSVSMLPGGLSSTNYPVDADEEKFVVRHGCDSAMAYTINGLYKTEVIHRRGPWNGLDDVEYATLEWDDWFNHKRILQPIGDVPPAEYEGAYHAEGSGKQRLETNRNSLQQTQYAPCQQDSFL